MNVLERPVLVLNKVWQPLCAKSVQEIVPMLCADVATAMLIEGDDIRPLTWAEWITLPIRDGDLAIHSPRLTVRAPTVVIAVNYAKVPLRRPALNARAIRERDAMTCQYSGKRLRPEEATIDHVVPRARGGRTSWENCVLAERGLNQRKSDRLPHEAGLRLRRAPQAPRALPASLLIRNRAQIPDWDLFLAR